MNPLCHAVVVLVKPGPPVTDLSARLSYLQISGFSRYRLAGNLGSNAVKGYARPGQVR